MAKKKAVPKKSTRKKTLLKKVSNVASHVKDDIVAGKDHVVEFAGEAFDLIKTGIKHLVETGKTKKATKNKRVKKSAPKKVAKKLSPKKAIKKTIKKIARKK